MELGPEAETKQSGTNTTVISLVKGEWDFLWGIKHFIMAWKILDIQTA